MSLTIYERNGGFPAVRKVISDFYDRVLDSSLLAHHFEDVNMARLMDHQTRFFSFLMGGPTSGYTDDHLRRVHAKLGITHGELEEMISIVEETLEDHDFSSEDVAAVAHELRRREGCIVAA